MMMMLWLVALLLESAVDSFLIFKFKAHTFGTSFESYKFKACPKQSTTMSTSKKKKDWSKAQLATQPYPKKQAELRDDFAILIEFKKELDDTAGQLIDETIEISKSIYWLDKNKDACPNKLTTVVVKKLSNSKNADLKKLGTDMARHIVCYDTAVVEWKDRTKRKEAVSCRINKNYNKIIAGVEKYKAIMIEEITAQNTNSATAQSALASSKVTLDKADQKNPNTQKRAERKAAKDKHAKAELELQTFRASKNDLSNDENKLQEEELMKDVESLNAKTAAGTSKRYREEAIQNYEASKAKVSELEHSKDSMTDEEFTQQRSVLLEDVAQKKSKTESGKYQQQNKICGFTREYLVGTAVRQMRSLHVPLSAPARSKERCEQFSEAFLSRDPKKIASLFFD